MQNSNLFSRLGVVVGGGAFTRREYRLLLYLALFAGLIVLGGGLRLLQGEVVRVGEEFILRPNYLPYYLLLAVAGMCVFFEIFVLPVKFYRFVIIFFAYKLPLSFCMLYLLLDRYGTGDIKIYFWNLFSDGFFVSNSGVTVQVNRFLFSFLPVSLLGLSVIMAFVGMLGYVILFGLFGGVARDSFQFLCVVFLIPTVGLMSGFIGRDSYNILALSCFYYCFYKLSVSSKKVLWIILVTFFALVLFWFRKYIGLMAIFSVGLCLITKKMPFWVVALTSVAVFFVLSFPYIIGFLGLMINPSLFKLGLSYGLRGAYAGGTHMLEPWPGILKVFQVFRPFPWEAENLPGLLAGFENLVILFFIVYRLFFIKKSILLSYADTLWVRLVFIFSVLYWTVFSFSANVGDLTRRRIYFIPMVLALLLEAKRVIASEPHEKT